MNEKENLAHLMELDRDEYAKQQYDALKEHTLRQLKTVMELVEAEQYADVRKRVKYSPAGDGYGYDNHYINFGYLDNEPYDIEDMLDKLQILKEWQD